MARALGLRVPAELPIGQGRVDRAAWFEVAPNEVNAIHLQASQLPYPRDLLFDGLTQGAYPSLGETPLDAGDGQMG